MIKKYVIIKGAPILFPVNMKHNEMVRKEKTVESAGFFLIVRDKENSKFNVICMGESTSLHISSRPEIDQEIIAVFLGLY